MLVAWNTPKDDGGSPVTGYCVYRGDTLLQTINITTTTTSSAQQQHRVTFTDKGLRQGTDYIYAVSSINKFGEGRPSEYLRLRTIGVADAPVNIQVVATSTTSLKLSWTIPDNNGGSVISAYKLYQVKAGFWHLDATLNATTLSHTYTQLKPGTGYSFK